MSSQSGNSKYLDVTSSAEHNVPGGVGVAEVLEVETIGFEKGELQEPAYRDKWFGIAFLLHLAAMVTTCILYATGSLESDFVLSGSERRGLQSDEDYIPLEESNAFGSENGSDSGDAVKFLSTFLLSVLIAPVLSIVMMTFMKTNAVQLIQYSLYFSIIFNVTLAIWMFVVNPAAAIMPLFFALVLMCYARAVWHRIPFAAANLRTAITAVQANLGMAFLALANIPLVTIWFVMWGYTMQCVVDSPWMKTQESEVMVTDDFNGSSNEHATEKFSVAGTFAIMGLLLSFYWTLQVLRNVVHTSLAGTVGTWWFLPHEANSCCSRGLTDSLCRSLTYSFGSICLGSLIVAIIEVIQTMLRSASRNNRGGILRSIAQCLLQWIERIAEYFNKWAFVYVGLYGYSYVEAGKNVIALFRNRGWTTIISDSLVQRMLLMMSFSIGLINAAIAGILTWMERADASVIGLSALFALFAGMLLSSLIFGVLISATDSIIVLFAEAPREFKENHPALAEEMEQTWAQAWPDVFSPGVGAVGVVSAASIV